MSERNRKCLKCGSSWSDNPKVSLHRFPKPGVRNIKRCEVWAKFCFPEGYHWATKAFQEKLYSEHRMLCSRHFPWSSFIDFDKKRLHRHAVPENECTMLETIPEVIGPMAGSSKQVVVNITDNSQPVTVRSPSAKQQKTIPVTLVTKTGTKRVMLDVTNIQSQTTSNVDGKKRKLDTEVIEAKAGPSERAADISYDMKQRPTTKNTLHVRIIILTAFSLLLQRKRDLHPHFQFGWTASTDLANSIAMSELTTPHLIVLNSTTSHHHMPDDDPVLMTPEAVSEFLDLIHKQQAPRYGGNNWPVRVYRALFEARTTLANMWRGNPVLTALVFGLPLGFLSLICYSVCCADILDAEEEEQQETHEKKD